MKLRQLESHLQSLTTFQAPKVHLEQYATSAHIASHMLFTAHQSYDDVEGRVVLDMGCGCGVLMAAAAMLGADFCIGVDIDEASIAICRENIDQLSMESTTDLVQTDATQISSLFAHKISQSPMLDTIVMNPPFGTKNNAGLDVKFLEEAFKLEPTRAIYSLHKSTTRQHIEKVARAKAWKANVLAQLRYDLPKTYKFHKHKSVDIEVDLIRFDR